MTIVITVFFLRRVIRIKLQCQLQNFIPQELQLIVFLSGCICLVPSQKKIRLVIDAAGGRGPLWCVGAFSRVSQTLKVAMLPGAGGSPSRAWRLTTRPSGSNCGLTRIDGPVHRRIAGNPLATPRLSLHITALSRLDITPISPTCCSSALVLHVGDRAGASWATTRTTSMPCVSWLRLHVSQICAKTWAETS